MPSQEVHASIFTNRKASGLGKTTGSHCFLCGNKSWVSLDNFPPFLFKYSHGLRVFVIVTLQKFWLTPTFWSQMDRAIPIPRNYP